MPNVNISGHQSFEASFRRFKRLCEKAGIVARLRQIRRYEKPTTKRKRQAAAAIKRRLKMESKKQESLDRDRTRFGRVERDDKRDDK